MGDFDCIETGFNCADETINFGSRSIAYDNLYEISTVACLKSTEADIKETKQVAINSLITKGRIIITTNRSIKIFEDTEFSKILYNVNLDFVPISLCVSSDGKLLLVCLENGNLSLFCLETFSCLYSDSIFPNFQDEGCSCVKSFEETLTKQRTQFIVVLSTGKIYRITINTENLKQDVEQEILIETALLHDLETLIRVSSFSYPVLVTEGTECCLLNVYTKAENRDDSYNLKTLSPFGNKFLGLDEDGNLFRICWLTLLIFQEEYDHLLDDLLVVEDNQIITITKKNEQGISFLQLLNSDLTPSFSLKISYPIELISLETTTDDILFISKIIKDDCISELRIQRVYETNIELRLKRLIKGQKFEEAEQFAKLFKINPTVILKAKAEVLVAKTECSREDIKNLIQLLDSIDDDSFILNCCSSVDCSHLDDVRKILEYGVKIVPRSHNKHLKKVLADLLFKFDTFMALSIHKDIESWSKFLTMDLIEEVKFYLKNFQIEDAIIMYNRLDKKSVEMSLNEENVEEILGILNNLPISVCRPFLNTFIPITINNKPSILSLFVKWLLNKILQLEKRENSQFPDNGLNLADSILKLLKVDKNSCISFQRHITLSRDSLNELAKIMDALKTLQKLKKEFGINVLLVEYLQGPKTLVKTLLNIIMSPADYERFLKDFLCTYMLQNYLDVDTILYEEIKDLIIYDDCCISIIEVILKCIGSVRVKLQAVKEILENSPVPWSDTIKKIALEMTQYSHPLASTIKSMLEDEKRIIVLKNPKYEVRGKEIITNYEFLRIVNRIIYVGESTFFDDVYNLCTTPQERIDASVMLVKAFVLEGNLEEVLNILNKCSKSEVYESTKWHLKYAELLFNQQCSSPSFLKAQENYYSMLRPLFARFSNSCDDEFEKQNISEKVNLLKGVYYVNNTFTRHITTEQLMDSSRNILFEELLGESIISLNTGVSDINEMLQLCPKLASCFSLDQDYVLIKLCEKRGNFEAVLKAAEYLYDNEANPKNLCLAVVLLLKYLASQELFQPSNNFNDSSEELQPAMLSTIFKSGECLSDSDMYLQGLKVAQKLINKALVNADKENILAVHEVMRWLNSCYYLTRVETPQQEDIYNNVFKSPGCAPTYTVFSTLKDVFVAYLGFAKSHEVPSISYLTHFCQDIPEMTEEQLLHQLSSLPTSIENFCREGLHLTAFNLLLTLERSLSIMLSSDSSVMKFLKSLINNRCLPLLIQVVISSKHIDTLLLLNLLLAAGKDYLTYIVYYLKMYKRQPAKLSILSAVGIKLLDFHKETQGRDVMADSIITGKWWKKLKTEDIQYDTFFKITPANRLSMLIGIDCMSVELIRDYCADYQLDPETYYMAYLKSCLLNWKPQYKCETDMNGKTRLIMETDEHTLIEKVQGITECIKDKAAIVPLLEKMLTKANFYHYEVFICIFKILAAHSDLNSRSADILVLFFLKSYRRFSQPSQREKEEWYTSFLDRQVLDPLSEFRLPYSQLLFTADVWSIIRPEINLNSYKCWFKVINILQNVKKDDICVYAVKQIVSSGILGNGSANSWILVSKFEDLFLEVDECLQQISDLERATSAVYHLMYHTPNGADKVNAAKLSFKYAIKYHESFPKSPEVEKAYIKVKSKYYGFSIMHILHKYNLAQEKYIQLATNSEALIEALYMDERIIKQAESVSLNCPDINKAVDEISTVFGLKIDTIRYNLLNSWLNSSTMDIDFDSTMTFPNSCITGNARIDENDQSLKRAIYLCNSGKKEYWENYLLKVGLNEESTSENDQKSVLFKAKALKCFCAITDEETIANLTKVSYAEFLNYIDKLMLLSQLECLGISLNINTLDEYNKKELLKRLLLIGKSLAIKVMGALCMTYSMEENVYWEFIINNSIKFDMITELKMYVDFLKDKYDQRYFINAWQTIINNSFQQLMVSSEEELEEIYINNFLMIQSSPVLFLLDFEKIIKHCIMAEKMEFAAVLLQYLPKEKRDLYVSAIIKKKTLHSDLDKLDEKGIWGVRNVKMWLANREC